jgi:hypothetical protein
MILSICGDMQDLEDFLGFFSMLKDVRGPFLYATDCTMCSAAGYSGACSGCDSLEALLRGERASRPVPYWRMRGPYIY